MLYADIGIINMEIVINPSFSTIDLLTVSGNFNAETPATTVEMPIINIGRGFQNGCKSFMIKERNPPTLATALQHPMALFLF